MNSSIRKQMTVRKGLFEYLFWAFSGPDECRLPDNLLHAHYFGQRRWTGIGTTTEVRKNDLIITFVRSGQFRFTVGARSKEGGPGFFNIVPAKCELQITPLAPGAVTDILGLYDNYHIREILRSSNMDEMMFFQPPDPVPFQQAFFRIHEILEENSPDIVQRVSAESYFILLELYRQSPARQMVTPLERLKRTIEVSPGKAYSLPELAADAGMSQQTFIKKFRAEYNTTPMHYVKQSRLNMACWLLKQEKYDIAEVARKTGWKNTANFITAFKKYSRLSPGSYRKKYGIISSHADYYNFSV